jgi:DNA-binding MarR family transcriptional regulator
VTLKLTAQSEMPLENEAPHLYRLHEAIHRTFHALAAPDDKQIALLDVPPSQFICLRYIVDHDGCKLVDLARERGLSLPNASRIIDRLVRRDLVTRRSDNSDRRVIRLHATDVSIAFIEAMHAERLKRLKSATKLLTTADIETISNSLILLADAADRAKRESNLSPK